MNQQRARQGSFGDPCVMGKLAGRLPFGRCGSRLSLRRTSRLLRAAATLLSLAGIAADQVITIASKSKKIAEGRQEWAFCTSHAAARVAPCGAMRIVRNEVPAQRRASQPLDFHFTPRSR